VTWLIVSGEDWIPMRGSPQRAPILVTDTAVRATRARPGHLRYPILVELTVVSIIRHDNDKRQDTTRHKTRPTRDNTNKLKNKQHPTRSAQIHGTHRRAADEMRTYAYESGVARGIRAHSTHYGTSVTKSETPLPPRAQHELLISLYSCALSVGAPTVAATRMQPSII
jgi:hypothetical protein